MSVVFLILAISFLPWTRASAGPVVQTKQGLVRGFITPDARVFKGIRYALPPVGPLRWKAPQTPKAWDNVMNATESGPSCPQTHCTDTTPVIVCPTTFSEDCLYLDIFTPLGAKNGSDLPVMFFIHGGNFFYLSGSTTVFQGEHLAKRGNVVLVTINYRLGALGFLVTGKTIPDATGNYGLLDQKLALQWVAQNIRGFGGDPNQITLFGQSAGGQSILHHMTSPKTSPYFKRAILQSIPITLPFRSYLEAVVLGGRFAIDMGCKVRDMDCLRSKSFAEIANVSYASRGQITSLSLLQQFEPYGPYVDGVEVKGQPLEEIKKMKKSETKPIMVGSLTEETVLYIYSAFSSRVDIKEYLGLEALLKPLDIFQIVQKYPPNMFQNDQREMLVSLSTDYIFTCPSRFLAKELVEKKDGDVWMYEWSHAMSFPAWGHITYCAGRACHGSELVFVFDTASNGNFTMTPDEVKLTTDVIAYWTNFAWSGDPNNDHKHSDKKKPRQVWPKFQSSNNWTMLQFETPNRKPVHGYRQEYCDFWDKLGYS